MPTNLRVVGVAATSLELEWVPGDGEPSWQLQWSKDGGLSWDKAPRLLEAPRCRKRNLPPDTLVVFRVRTVSARGDVSSWATVEGRTALPHDSQQQHQRAPESAASAFQAAVSDEIHGGGSPAKSEGDEPSRRGAAPAPADAHAADEINDAFARASQWASTQAAEAWEAPGAAPAAEERWHELVDKHGNNFFWNEATGDTKWDREPHWVRKQDASGAEYYVEPARHRRKRRSRRPSSSPKASDAPASSRRPSLDAFLPNMRRQLSGIFGAGGGTRAPAAAASG